MGLPSETAPLDRRTTDGRTESERPAAPWRRRLHAIVLESDTPAGQAFDIVVIAAILLSVLVVVLDSMSSVRAAWRPWLDGAEWVFTVLFTAEYLARLVGVRRQLRYAVSFYGVIDLQSVLPSYLAPASHPSGALQSRPDARRAPHLSCGPAEIFGPSSSLPRLHSSPRCWKAGISAFQEREALNGRRWDSKLHQPS